MMNRFQRLFALLALLLGLLGVVVCVAAIAVVWSVSSRISQANQNLFDGVDRSLAAVRDRVLGAQRRVQDLKISTEDIGQSVKNWTRKEASERLASQLELAEKAERLAAGLRQVDQWLVLSETSIQSVQQTLDLGSSLGARVDPALIGTLLEKLQAVQARLKQSTETVDEIRERVTRIAEGEALDERIDQVAQMALRLLATLGEIDSRIGKVADRVADAQTKGQHLKSKTHKYIVTAEICAFLLVAWMAAGQASLCRHGWKDYRQSRSAA